MNTSKTKSRIRRKSPAASLSTDHQAFDEFDGHESVMYLNDKASGLRGFIAIHNTNLGPAVGGTRYWYYKIERDALRDALRLSRAMTYKCALSDVPYGGGKAVLMAPRMGAHMSKSIAKAYAAKLSALSRPFHTGEDVGMREEDIVALSKMAPKRIIGRPNKGGLPSEWAALSVFHSMRAALVELYGSDSFNGKTVAIKGIGNVGSELCRLLTSAGASVIVADIVRERTLAAKKYRNVTIVSPKNIARQKVDIYAPCALGGEFTNRNIRDLSCKIVCGAANNQLSTPGVGPALHRKGILYVPDYVANAGGLINVVSELHRNGYSRRRVTRSVEHLFDTVRDIISRSRSTRTATSVIADRLAEKRFLRPRS